MALVAVSLSACSTTTTRAHLSSLSQRGDIGLIAVAGRWDPTADTTKTLLGVYGERPWRGHDMIRIAPALRRDTFPARIGIDVKSIVADAVQSVLQDELGVNLVVSSTGTFDAVSRNTVTESWAGGDTLVHLNDTLYADDPDWSKLDGFSAVVLVTFHRLTLYKNPSEFFGWMDLIIVDVATGQEIHRTVHDLRVPVATEVAAPFFPDIALNDDFRSLVVQYHRGVTRDPDQRRSLANVISEVFKIWARDAVSSIEPQR